MDFNVPWQQAHWLCDDANQLKASNLEADVVIIGSGAGGAIAASALSASGLSVIILEAGSLNTAMDFRQEEIKAYQELYQDAGNQMTADGAIQLYQGKTVGGSSVINWTSNFRTPLQTLDHWREHWSLNLSESAMNQYFERVEKRLGISPWMVKPNENNAVLQRGCERLGFHYGRMERNVKGCWNLGYCGMGCPTNAKQSMLMNYLPDALEQGTRLIYNAEADKLIHQYNSISSLQVRVRNPKFLTTSKITIYAKTFVLAAGAIHSPGLLLRSKVPDPFKRLGKRTFLHPTCASIALFDHPIEPYYGAPQSIYSDAFLWPSHRESIGFKLEVPPIHPGLAAQMLGTHGTELERYLKELPKTQACIALLRDGFNELSQGGQVVLNNEQKPILDYEFTPQLWKTVMEAYKAMAEIQFAAGAKGVLPLHLDAGNYWRYSQAKQAITQLPKKKFRARLMSAHIMGGCAATDDVTKGVVNNEGRHHQLDNCYVIDGSVFPTSVGANPQLSIYALSLRNAERLAFRL